jgi:hypothetical protein
MTIDPLALHNLPADRQADAGAEISRSAVQTLKYRVVAPSLGYFGRLSDNLMITLIKIYHIFGIA